MPKVHYQIYVIELSKRVFIEKEWEKAANAHGEFFSKILPACTFVEVKGFIKPDWLIETEADCVL